MAGKLKRWLDGSADPPLWIDFADYAHRVFAQQSDSWLTDPNSFVGGLSQAQGVINSEVIAIDIVAPYIACTHFADASPASAVQAMLEDEDATRYVENVLDALVHRFGADIDLILQLPTPAALLRTAGLEEAASFDDLDDTAIALVNVVRRFADKPLDGILLIANDTLSDDEAEALESVVSAVRHYGWHVAVSFTHDASEIDASSRIDADVLLYPEQDFAAISAAANDDSRLGGGLGKRFWQADTPLEADGAALFYGLIPQSTQPELVLSRIAALRGT